MKGDSSRELMGGEERQGEKKGVWELLENYSMVSVTLMQGCYSTIGGIIRPGRGREA
jgi:hypothetical protein